MTPAFLLFAVPQVTLSVTAWMAASALLSEMLLEQAWCCGQSLQQEQLRWSDPTLAVQHLMVRDLCFHPQDYSALLLSAAVCLLQLHAGFAASFVVCAGPVHVTLSLLPNAGGLKHNATCSCLWALASTAGDAVVVFMRALCAISQEELEAAGVATSAAGQPPIGLSAPINIATAATAARTSSPMPGFTGGPRLFSLQKVVECAYQNMGRIRLVWSKLWAVIAAQLVGASCHPHR